MHFMSGSNENGCSRVSCSSCTSESFTSTQRDRDSEEKKVDDTEASNTSSLHDIATQTYSPSSTREQVNQDVVDVTTEKTVNAGKQDVSAFRFKRTNATQSHGFLGRLCLLCENDEPKEYSNKIKWFITLTVALAAAAAPLGSAIILRKFFLEHRKRM